jgi:hypothetical protein
VPDRNTTLQRACAEAGLGIGELWLRYFALGGIGSPVEVDAYVHGGLQPSDHEYDMLVHAINERFLELGGEHSVPYSDSA